MARPTFQAPVGLQRRAFTVTEAREQGISRRTLEHQRFHRPHQGVRRLASEDSAEPPSREYSEGVMLQRAFDYLPLLRPGEAFSHTTALLLRGVPINVAPDVHVTIRRPAGQARGQGIFGHRSGEALAASLVSGRLQCVLPETALLQVASTLRSHELVVAIDALVRANNKLPYSHPHVSLDELRSRAHTLTGHGVRRYRTALELARVGAESRMETLLRLELAAMGINDLELQANIFDDDGEWIGRFDLADRVRKRLLEYDGEQHRLDRAQYLKDQERLSRAWAAGYQVLRLGKEDIAPSARTRTRRRLCAFLERDPHPIPTHLRKFLAAGTQSRSPDPSLERISTRGPDT